jgi:hypothetical protein
MAGLPKSLFNAPIAVHPRPLARLQHHFGSGREKWRQEPVSCLRKRHNQKAGPHKLFSIVIIIIPGYPHRTVLSLTKQVSLRSASTHARSLIMHGPFPFITPGEARS